MRFLVCAILSLMLPQSAVAKPLIRHSEENAARLCLADTEDGIRQEQLCRTALHGADVTDAVRGRLLEALTFALIDQAKYDEAEAAAREAIALEPLNPEAMSALGWVFWTQDRQVQAEEAFRKSTEIRATAEGFAGLASSMVLDVDPIEDDLLQRVLETFDVALLIDPDYAWALRDRGWVLRRAGRYQAAVESFEAALAVDEDDANAHFGKARALRGLDRGEDALKHLGRAIEIEPTNIGYFLQRASLLRLLDRNAQAIPDAETAIGLGPDMSSGYLEKAFALIALERWGEALDVFQTGIGAGADDNRLLYWYADTLADDGQMARAMEIIDAALEKPGHDSSDYTLKAYIAMKLKAYDTALDAADKALVEDATDPYGHYYAALALLAQDRLDAGLERFDAAMEAGLPGDMVGDYAAALITHGKLLAAIALRRKY